MPLENNSDVIIKALLNQEIGALGANRQRLTTLMKPVPGSWPIGELRASGFLRDSIAKSGATGVEMAKAGPVSRHGCPG